jgi:hypothetical protein
MNASDFTKLLTPIALGLLLPTLVTAHGCKKDEPPPPLPSAAPEPAATAPPLELVAEDAGPEDTGTDAPKPKGTGRSAGSIKACCQALQQNSASAPEPNATYMKQAAATCFAMAGTGAGQASILSAISGALRGAGMPSVCR